MTPQIVTHYPRDASSTIIAHGNASWRLLAEVSLLVGHIVVHFFNRLLVVTSLRVISVRHPSTPNPIAQIPSSGTSEGLLYGIAKTRLKWTTLNSLSRVGSNTLANPPLDYFLDLRPEHRPRHDTSRSEPSESQFSPIAGQ